MRQPGDPAFRFRLRGAAKRYVTLRGETVPALAPLSLDIRTGEFLVIVGPSGCGKSTLLSLLAGFEMPSEGSVTTPEGPVAGPGPDRIVVFQDHALFPWMSVADNVAFGLRAQGVPAPHRRARVAEVLDLVGLSAAAARFPHELSGGMRQRAALARALAPRPSVLLLDEPFAALDALTREAMQAELLRLFHAVGGTFVLITHSVDEAVLLADRVLVLGGRPGRILETLAVARDAGDRDGFARSPAFLRQRDHLAALLRGTSSARAA